MYLNNLIDKEDTLEELEKIRAMSYPDDFVEVAEDGTQKKKRTGPVVKYGDVVRAVEGMTPAIYKMRVQEVDELNKATEMYRPEDRRQPYVPEKEQKPKEPEEREEDLMPGVKISKIKDCNITVNISKGGKE